MDENSSILQDIPNQFSGFCPIPPEPKGRPRVTIQKGHPHAYTPPQTRKYENAVRKQVLKTYGDREPLDGNITANYIFVFERNTNTRKKDYYKNTKPDLDNLIKAFQDALNYDGKAGILREDSRIITTTATKRYTKENEKPGTYYSFNYANQLIIDCIKTNHNDFIKWNNPTIPIIKYSELTNTPSNPHITNILLLISIDQETRPTKPEIKKLNKTILQKYPNIENIDRTYV